MAVTGNMGLPDFKNMEKKSAPVVPCFVTTKISARMVDDTYLGSEEVIMDRIKDQLVSELAHSILKHTIVKCQDKDRYGDWVFMASVNVITDPKLNYVNYPSIGYGSINEQLTPYTKDLITHMHYYDTIVDDQKARIKTLEQDNGFLLESHNFLREELAWFNSLTPLLQARVKNRENIVDNLAEKLKYQEKHPLKTFLNSLKTQIIHKFFK